MRVSAALATRFRLESCMSFAPRPHRGHTVATPRPHRGAGVSSYPGPVLAHTVSHSASLGRLAASGTQVRLCVTCVCGSSLVCRGREGRLLTAGASFLRCPGCISSYLVWRYHRMCVHVHGTCTTTCACACACGRVGPVSRTNEAYGSSDCRLVAVRPADRHGIVARRHK